MNKILVTLTAFFGVILILSCSSATNTKEVDISPINTAEPPSRKLFSINGEDIVIRTDPGEK